MTTTNILAQEKMRFAIFIISILMFFYWLSVLFIIKDVYHNSFVGAVYEIFWLPMIMLLVIMPIINFLSLLKAGHNFRMIQMASLLFNLATIVLIILR